MKLTHFKNNDIYSSSTIFSLSGKAAFLIFFVFLMLKTTSTRSLRGYDNRGNETDHIALLAVKRQLVDHPKGVLSSWNDSVHHCNWEGVTCDHKHSRVTVLDLNSRGLAGTISPFIGNLSFLKNISLYNNSLHGQIPSNLGNLFRLRELWLSNNTIVGKIPANLSSCINLRVLSLDFNKLDGKLPTELRALSKLEDFGVTNNNLTGPLFDIIQNFTSLVIISAAYNSFTGTIPDSISRMQNLNYLALGMNKLSGALPASLFNISSLQMIDLALNDQLHGELPPDMGIPTPYLVWLNLAGNYFSGSIPMTITNLTNLEYMGLNENSFTGKVPRDLGHFPNLNYFSVEENYLMGDLNFINTLVNCTQLSALGLRENNFSGTLPISIVNLSTTLTLLALGASLIEGTFPADITKLINLELLQIAETKLSGYLPHDIGKLSKLEFLDLHSNRLTGKIPNSLGDLSFLSELYLQGNILEGSLPSSLVNCQSLLYLNLSYNQLSGTLSNEIFEGSAAFIELEFSHNHLEGTLPSDIGRLTTLQYLKIDGNFFHGDVPSSFASLASLQEINFSRNNLSGTIPAFFSIFTSINHLDLSYNNFEGRVPTNSVFANASAVSLVGNSGLCGGVQQLHLPKCIENEGMEKKKRSLSHTLKLVIPVISAFAGALIMATGIYVACTRKKMRPPSSGSPMGESFMKVSYQQLLKATSGFSSENLLGSGSFGSVFKGILDGKTVAVKVINLQHRAASKSFIAECKSLRNIRHRNLVGIITACSSIDYSRNDFRALIYEFMPNGSLDRWLNRILGNMSLSQRVAVAIDVAHALNYLHHECETPIVHRDLKPSNILLDQDMVAHVGDFGLAKFLTQPQHPNQSSTIGIRGTIGYAAPEYGQGSQASTAGDVYSYGILLLELMTGKKPTDSIFKEDYNLHRYAKTAIPDQVLQIADPTLEEDILTEEADDRRAIQDTLQRRKECIISVVSVGVSCSNLLPQDRMKITDAISMLQSSRDNLLNARNRSNHPARGAQG
ncbi:hypothetical protein RND81_10G206200 [Saponaria officinalis]|uniref:non-specific serine/threonine protein kinase n=1 Tax=Saponaria officinalis TaxID=3572 RepID=A0AAW1I6Z7_SAPOF